MIIPISQGQLIQSGSRKSPRDLAVRLLRSKTMNSLWALKFVVDPEQAQENISYGRALNSEACLSSHLMIRDNYLHFKSINLSF